MTVKQFQEIYLLRENSEGMSDIEITSRAVAIYKGIDYEDIDRMKLKEFNKSCAEINRNLELDFTGLPKYLRVGTRFYWINYKASETAGRYVEGAEFGKDMILNLHKILASCVQPMTWYGKIKPFKAEDHAKYADDMRKVSFDEAYSVGVFFYHLFRELMRASQPYMVQEAVLKGANREEVMQSLKDLQRSLDGLPQPSKLQNTNGLN